MAETAVPALIPTPRVSPERTPQCLSHSKIMASCDACRGVLKHRLAAAA